MQTLPAAGLRLFTVYGPFGRPDMAVMTFTKKLLRRDPIIIPCFPIAGTVGNQRLLLLRQHLVRLGTFGLHGSHSAASHQAPHDGSCLPPYRDFTAISDVVSGILAACNKTAMAAASGTAQHRVYNVGRGQPQSVLLLLQLLQALLGRSANVTCVQAGISSADVWATWAATAAAQRDLGFEPRVGLQQGLQEFVKWYVEASGFIEG